MIKRRRDIESEGDDEIGREERDVDEREEKREMQMGGNKGNCRRGRREEEMREKLERISDAR